MFVYKNIQKTITRKVETVCNKCGQVIETTERFTTCRTEGCIMAPEDTTKPPSFHLCPECTEELVASFVIPKDTDNEIEMMLYCDKE